MSAEDLYHALVTAITDGPGVGTPILDQWRLGFVIGQMIGLLNSDLASGDRDLSCLELLSRKCQRLYPTQERGEIHA